MRNRLDSFFMDPNYRWLIYAVSCVVSVLYSSVNLLALHRGKTSVAFETAAVFCLFFALGIGLYSVLREAPKETSAPPTQREWLNAVFSLPAITIVLLFIITSNSGVLPKLQAAVIDARLERANRTNTHVFTGQSPEQADRELLERFQKLQSIADISYRYQIPVGAKSLSEAIATAHTSLNHPAISGQTKQAGLVASAELVGLAALRSTEANTQRRQSLVFSSFFEISDQNIRFTGDHTLFTLNDLFLIRRSTVVFDGIDFRAVKPTMLGLTVEDSSSTVIVRNSDIENLSQMLDPITWIDVQFRHSMVKLGTAPFALVNVSFMDCDLRWIRPPAGGPVGEELYEMITKAGGQPITFASEGSFRTIPKPAQ